MKPFWMIVSIFAISLSFASCSRKDRFCECTVKKNGVDTVVIYTFLNNTKTEAAMSCVNTGRKYAYNGDTATCKLR